MFSQSLFEDQADMSSQLGFFTFPPNYNNNMGSAITTTTLPFGICNHKTLTIIPPSFAADNNSLIESTALRQKEDLTTSIFGGPHLLSLQKSTANTW